MASTSKTITSSVSFQLGPVVKGSNPPFYQGTFVRDDDKIVTKVAIREYSTKKVEDSRYTLQRNRDLELLRKPVQMHENFIRFIHSIEKDGFL